MTPSVTRIDGQPDVVGEDGMVHGDEIVRADGSPMPPLDACDPNAPNVAGVSNAVSAPGFVDVLYAAGPRWALQVVDLSKPEDQKRVDDSLRGGMGGYARRCTADFWERYARLCQAATALEAEFHAFPRYSSSWHARLSLDGAAVAEMEARSSPATGRTPLPFGEMTTIV